MYHEVTEAKKSADDGSEQEIIKAEQSGPHIGALERGRRPIQVDDFQNAQQVSVKFRAHISPPPHAENKHRGPRGHTSILGLTLESWPKTTSVLPREVIFDFFPT